MALSELAAQFQKMRGAKHQPGRPGARMSPRSPAMPGMVRGTAGSRGAQRFKGRNSMSAEQKEMQMMQSPVFRAFLSQIAPQTPVTDFLKGGR